MRLYRLKPVCYKMSVRIIKLLTACLGGAAS